MEDGKNEKRKQIELSAKTISKKTNVRKCKLKTT